MSSQMIDAVEATEIHFSREDDRVSLGEAMMAKKEESAEVELFENPASASTKSGNNANAEEVYVEMGEQEIREVNGSIDAIERCESNELSLYMFFCCLNYKYNM